MYVLVVNGSSYYTPFKNIGKFTDDAEILDNNPEDVALVVFTGGEDVSPDFYGEVAHPQTYANKYRDLEEKAIFEKVAKLNIPIVGICRGAQFLCVMAGGKLHQHVEKHCGVHNMETIEGKTIKVNSTHHQMQIPPSGAKLLSWAAPSRHFDENYKESECVYYKNINAVGMQYHPECMSSDSEGFKYCQELTNKLINKTL